MSNNLRFTILLAGAACIAAGAAGAGPLPGANSALSNTPPPNVAAAASSPASASASAKAAASAAAQATASAAAAAAALTASTPNAANMNLSDTLTRIEADTMVLRARDRQLGVQAAIISKQADIILKQGESDREQRGPKVEVVGNPVVQSIEGVGPVLYATLELESGATVEVQAGDLLANGMRVVSVRLNAVVVETSKKQRLVLAAARPPLAINPLYPAAGAGAGAPAAPAMNLPLLSLPLPTATARGTGR